MENMAASLEKAENSYAGIADFYDQLMTGGYYDYSSQSTTLAELINEGDTVLELGVGTGLLAKRLLKKTPEIEFVGIDNTENMLTQAKRRLGDDVTLVDCDVVSMDLEQEFDFVFSNGGVWYFIETDSGYLFCSHLPEKSDNYAAMETVADHLADDGRLVFSVQGVHEDYSAELKDGLVYEQEIEQVSENCFDKYYRFRKNGDCIAEQRCRYRLFSERKAREMLRDVDLEFSTTTPCGQYREFTAV